MKNSKVTISEELIREISNLRSRAIKVGYKNIMPKLPTSNKNLEQSMIGFNYRLDNWKKQLIQMENPGGIPTINNEKPDYIDSLRQIVINMEKKKNQDDDFSEDELI